MTDSVRVTAGGVLVQGDRLLLGKRAVSRADYPGVWDIIGGHQLEGEAPEETLVREFQEEAGVTPLSYHLLAVLTEPASEFSQEMCCYVYAVMTWSGSARNLQEDEHSELAWVEVDEVKSLDLAVPSYAVLFQTIGRIPSLGTTDDTPQDKPQTEQAYQLGLRLLSYRARSRRELAQRLARRFPEAAVQEALAQLEAGGYLDDAAFAQQWRRSREAHRPRGAALVRQELRAHGVSREVAEAAVQDMDDAENAYRAAQRHLKALAGLDYPAFHRRLSAYLRRRGFPQDVVRHTVGRVWEEREGVGA
ncbi:MAG: RecX family transcriptional regulator [Chloroflexi bacterium]|nr:RecX family transcriptional regulator [Chloroflexota bacterium]